MLCYALLSNQYNNKYIILHNAIAFDLSSSQSTAFFKALL